jgi:hypothetical protein
VRIFVLFVALIALAGTRDQVVWKFDNINQIGGLPTTVLGHPHVVKTDIGKAIEFNGIDDGLFIDGLPLAGAEQYTWEAIFRPDGGPAEQRWFHLQENGSENRLLFEIRVIGDQWCLDSFRASGKAQKALLDRSKLHPLGQWYHVAAVYDGKQFRSYIDRALDGSAEITFPAVGNGRTAVGVRMNKVYYFKGAVHLARFTRRALTPSEFLKLH